MLSAEELLAGSSLTYEIEVPAEVLRPGEEKAAPGTVRLRPLTVQDLQRITRAARENDTLVAALMVQHALVDPPMKVAQVVVMPVGLMQFLLHEVNRLSGIEVSAEALDEAVEAPLARAAFILAREFGWTPQQVNALTLGQILLHLQMLKEAS